MMRLFLLLQALLMLPAVLSAQHTISGHVTDVQGIPVASASIRAISKADSSIATAMPDSTGHYLLHISSNKSFFLKATALGHDALTKSIVGLKQDTVIDFRMTEQQTITGLDGVTVQAQKPLLERRTDRTIFNVSASITAIGSNAYEAMKKAPGVVVQESNNSISLAGRSGAQVMVNGRLLQLSGEDLTAYLQAIPAESLDRIEVITTPPAQYDAAGNAGLINIVLKKERKAGFNGTARVGYEQSSYGTGIAGASLNYRRGKLNVYGTASGQVGAKGNVEELSTYYPGQVFELKDPYRKQTANLNYTVGVDYEPDRKSTLGVQYTNTTFTRREMSNTLMTVKSLPALHIDSLIKTTGPSATNRRANALNLSYTHNIDTTGRKLTLNANRLWFDGSRNQTSGTVNYRGVTGVPTGASADYRNEGEQNIVITTVQADAELPYSWASFSLGGKLSFINNSSRNDFLDGSNGIYIVNPGRSDAFTYREAVQALYLSAQKAIGKWSFQGGLRAEATTTEGTSRSLNQTNKNNYLDLFPTAYIEYKKSDAQVLSLNYSKRINRPGYAELNPFRLYTSPYSYTEGNPFLQPSYSHNAELNYTLQGKYTFSVYYQYERAHFGQRFYADSLNSTNYVTNANLGDLSAIGASVTAAWKPAKCWELQAIVNANRQSLVNNGAGGNHAYSLPNVYCSASNNITLNKKGTLLAEANVWYLSKYLNDQFYFNPIASVDTGIRAMLMEKRLVVSLSAIDIFATQRSRGVNQVTGQTINSYFDQRSLRLMLNYRFGSDKVKARQERSTGVEAEQGRV